MPGSVKAIDCDIHPDLPGIKALLPYLDEFWRESVVDRGIDSLDTINYPPNAPITARPDWRGKNGRAGTDLSALQGRDPVVPRRGAATHDLFGKCSRALRLEAKSGQRTTMTGKAPA